MIKEIFKIIIELSIVFLVGILVCNKSKANKLIRVAVIDSGLNLVDERFSSHLCAEGHKDLTGEGIEDTDGHGTHVTGLIIKYADKSNYCLIILKYFSEKQINKTNIDAYLKALHEAINLDVDIINFSGGGLSFLEDEYNIIKYNSNTLFFVAAGNENSNMDIKGHEFFPGYLSKEFNNVVTVGALDSTGKNRYMKSNYGKCVKRWEIGENILSSFPNNKNGYMSGTSMSTAIFTGKYIYEKSH